MESCPDLSAEDIDEMVNMSFVDPAAAALPDAGAAGEGVPEEGGPP